MATINNEPITTYLETVSDGPPKVLVLPEGASVTAKKGEIATFSAGYVIEGSDNEDSILGFFAEDAHNDTAAGTHTIAVYIACNDTIFRGNLKTGSGSNYVSLQTNLGVVAGLYRDTTNSIVVLDIAPTAANVRCVIQRLIDPVGDTNIRVMFQIIPKWTALTVTS